MFIFGSFLEDENISRLKTKEILENFTDTYQDEMLYDGEFI